MSSFVPFGMRPTTLNVVPGPVRALTMSVVVAVGLAGGAGGGGGAATLTTGAELRLPLTDANCAVIHARLLPFGDGTCSQVLSAFRPRMSNFVPLGIRLTMLNVVPGPLRALTMSVVVAAGLVGGVGVGVGAPITGTAPRFP